MAAAQHGRYRDIAGHAMNKARFEAFSDGVFAFAITLLILGVALPAFKTAPGESALRDALLALWPNVLAYALSFAVIGIMWQNHHALFRMIERVDRTTIFLNLLLLAGTVFIPFATSVLGTYPAMHTSTFLYGVVLTYCSTVYNLMLAHLIRSRAFRTDISPETVRGTLNAYRTGWTTYVAATLIALVAPLVSFAAYIFVTLYYLIPHGVDRDLGTP
ncbi:MAG: DUF1211 domain-containing protein [Candidatus Eremiobacteraeota bacterium]|nr:DUF1211 domain-containing protein [Candidatus Eremiobacteraeota bacterium]